MTKNRERLVLWIGLEVIFIVLVFIGSVYDFNISYALSGVTVKNGALVSNVSFLAKALEVIGEWPALFLTAFALCVIIVNIKKLVKKSNVALLFVVLCYIASAILMFRGWHASFKDILGAVKGWHYAIIIPLTLALTVLMRIAVSKIKKETVKRFFIPAVVTVITALVVLLVLEAIKISWGRVRLREIVAANDPTLFTSWYVPNWFSGSKSFPSGHMGYGALTFLIPIWFENKSDRKRRLTYLGLGAYMLIMGFSRMCAAAHYLTDVTFGFAISFIIVQIATIKYEKSFMEKPVPKFIKTTEMTTTGLSTKPIPSAPVKEAPSPAPAAQRQPQAQPRQEQAPAQKQAAPTQAQKQAAAPKPAPKPTPAKAPEQTENSKFIPKSKLKEKKKRKTLRELLGLDKKKPAPAKKQAPAKPAPKPAPKPTQASPAKPAPKPAASPAPKPEQKPEPKPVPDPAPKPTQAAASDINVEPIKAPADEENGGDLSANPPTLTSFSLDRARAEKAEREAAIAARNQEEAKKIDDKMKLAVTGEIKDISVPVEPKQKAQSQTVKRKAPSKPGTRKKAAPKDDTAVQMHFKFDNESNSLTSDISDD